MRSFVALPLDSDVREELGCAAARLRDRRGGDELRWVPAQNLHLTLRFLGDVSEDAVPVLLSALRAEVAALDCFSGRLDGLSLFPSRARPRVLAVRVTPEEEFLGLARSVEAAVVAAGFEPEVRRFRAHITLARFRRSGRGQLELAGEVAALRVDVCDVVLYQSILGRAGARYRELGRVALAPSGTREAAQPPANTGECL